MLRISKVDTILLSVILVWGCTQAPSPVEPAPANDFISSIECIRVDPGKAPIEFDRDLEIKVNQGFVVHFSLDPNAEFPREYHGDRVCSFDQWGMCVSIAPRNNQHSRKHTVYNPVNPLHFVPYPGPVNRGSLARWTECGLELKDFPQHPLSSKKKNSSTLKPPPKNHQKLERLYFWTYLCGPKDEAGDFVYEIQLYPTSYYTTPIRTHSGDYVVLKRGTLRILPKVEGEGQTRNSG